MKNVIVIFISCVSCALAIVSGYASAEKRSLTDFNWQPKEENVCVGSLCVRVEDNKFPDPTERIDKADRMRRTDKFSEFNSDSGNDSQGVSGSMTFFEWN